MERVARGVRLFQRLKVIYPVRGDWLEAPRSSYRPGGYWARLVLTHRDGLSAGAILAEPYRS